MLLKSGMISKKFSENTRSLIFQTKLTDSHALSPVIIAVPGGGRGQLAPQVSKIWIKFKFFGQ